MHEIKYINGKFNAKINIKGIDILGTFSSEQLATLWINYQKDLIEDMNSFNEKAENIITFEQAVDLKTQSIKNRELDKRTLLDFESIKNEFPEIMNLPIGKISLSKLNEITQEKLGSVVRRGGNKKSNSGHARITSPKTVLRKLRILASVFSYMIENGADISNVAQSVIGNLKSTLKKN